MREFASFDAFNRELGRLGQEIERGARVRIGLAQAALFEKIAAEEASRDFGGDPKFSGWAPSLDGLKVKSLNNGAVLVSPTRVSAGPWTVAEFGRHQGNAGGFAGPGIGVKTGRTSRNKDGSVRKVRQRKAKRWNGTTTGKGTATKATERAQEPCLKIADVGLRRATIKHFDVD